MLNHTSRRQEEFTIGKFAVYPTHGVGKITTIESIEVFGKKTELLTLFFEKERLTLKVPSSTAVKSGLRVLSSKQEIDEIFTILRSGVRKMKGMWSRRSQEYEDKINSGELRQVAEVLRDLTRDVDDSERSYSERMIYETALYRLASEYAAVKHVEFDEAYQYILKVSKDNINIAKQGSATE